MFKEKKIVHNKCIQLFQKSIPYLYIHAYNVYIIKPFYLDFLT